jgi:hypothetical protein
MMTAAVLYALNAVGKISNEFFLPLLPVLARIAIQTLLTVHPTRHPDEAFLGNSIRRIENAAF